MTTITNPASRTTSPITDRPATAVARGITGNDYVSWSQINAFRGCPRKYQFLYVEKAPPDFIPTALQFGGAVHSALEALFRAKLEGQTVNADDLFDIFMGKWAERRPGEEDVPLKFNQKENPGAIFDLARRMIGAFQASSEAQPEGEIVAVEEQLRLALHHDLPDVLCRVDLIWEDPDAMHLVDFKTSRGRWSQEKADASAEQLLLYQHMAGAMASDLELPTRLQFIVLTKHRAPVIQLFDVAGDAGRLNQITETFRSVWAGIAAGNFYPNPSPQNCSTCPFQGRCPAFAGK